MKRALSLAAVIILISYSSFTAASHRSHSTRLYRKIYHNDDGSFDIASAPMLDFNENYYRVLGVDSNASPSVIKKQFLKQIFAFHPDKVKKEDENREELIALRNQQTMVINSAYRILRDVTLRAEYDMKNREPVRVKSSTSSGGFGNKVVLSAVELEQKAQDKAAQDELKRELKERSKRDTERRKREDKAKEDKVREAQDKSRSASKKAGRTADPTTAQYESSLKERFPSVPPDLLEIYKEDFRRNDT